MKVLTLGLGAFGFAINKLLGENNKNEVFYVLELKQDVCEEVTKTREHPYFFKGYKLPNNIKIINNYDDIIGDIDLLILAIPAQCIDDALEGLDKKLKFGVIILNLAKGIDIKNNITISELIEKKFKDFSYNYSVLSGGMIAEEVVKQKFMGADLGINDFSLGEKIKSLFENDYFKVVLRKDVLNIELYGSLKNILAIIVGYYEGIGNDASTIGYYLVEVYEELKEIVYLYGGNKNFDFSYYSLGGDIIATCFGASRNRYFGRLLGEGKKLQEVIDILKKENKHAEGYETYKAVMKKIGDKKEFKFIKKFYEIIK